jgi:hypothetical protein
MLEKFSALKEQNLNLSFLLRPKYNIFYSENLHTIEYNIIYIIVFFWILKYLNSKL